MRKTTEELWKQALAEQTVDSDVPEAFRRLVIENERECAEAVATVNHCRRNSVGWHIDYVELPTDTPLFTFPPIAIDPRDEVIQQQSEALRMAREEFEHIREYWNGDVYKTAMLDALNHIDDVAEEALAEIDKVLKEGK